MGDRVEAAMAVLRVVGAAVLCVLAVACSAPAPAPVQSPTVAVAPTTGVPFPTLSSAPLPEAQTASLEQEVARWVDSGLLSGVTVAVVTQTGSWSAAAGVDGQGTALVPEAAMGIASITKTFVAAEVMHLEEAGRLDLDAAASAYLVHPQTANGVTVRQLLSMRSGLVDPPDEVYEVLGEDPDRHWDPEDALALYTSPPRPPGGRLRYQNANYWLLGMLVEKVTGRPLATVLRTDLWAPHGLSRIAYQDQESISPPLGRPGPDELLLPKDLTPGQVLPFRSVATLAGAAGGVASDAPTIARWGYLLYGGHVLGAGASREMREAPREHGYGLGTWQVDDGRWGQEVVGHLGELPGYRTVLAVFPELRVSVAIFTTGSALTAPYVPLLLKAGGMLPGPGS